MERKGKIVLTRDGSCQTEPSHPDLCQPGPAVPSATPQTPVRTLGPGELSSVQKQTFTSLSGIEQIIECFRSGTAELMHTLLREVDTIFECKLCRSLFRGLPNLVRHKEFYCFSRSDEAGVTSPGDQNQPMMDLLKDRPGSAVKQGHKSTQNTFSSEENQTQLREQETANHDHENLKEHLTDVTVEKEIKTDDSNRPVKVKFGKQEVEWMKAKRDEERAKQADALSISCSLCGKDFSSLCRLRQHCLRIHKDNPDDLRRLRGKLPLPVGLQSGGRGRSQCPPGTPRHSCGVCGKPFVSKATMQRHLDSEHRAQYQGSTAMGKPGGGKSSPPPPQHKMMTRHKYVFRTTRPSRKGAMKKHSVRTKIEPAGKVGGKTKASQDAQSLRLSSPKLQIGFDLKQHYCRICKRQFTSGKNLRKHIDRHVEGNEIFVKFFRCPLCIYESRRTSDLIRHMKVVHKKLPSYLDKVMPKVVSQAIKKPVEMVLDGQTTQWETTKASRRGHGGSAWSPAPYRDTSAIRSSTTIEGGTEKKAKKKIPLHTCDACGRAFSRKVNLEVHCRSHVTARTSRSLQSQRAPSTRSKMQCPQWMPAAS
ncbi:zinc finger protein 800-like [Brienomyrus brachyistius]|uniref:zinc finger protein 800-like n=1 Tax=Brienomyrus brachyistius TaxID=42636 RepID=UPI0020B2C94D|nr:zinc finger protein 800-like [Brienomyrus brachyistius]XP_048863117.1 zinc finger protein 800-like [Brienomyrus brachyistius]